MAGLTPVPTGVAGALLPRSGHAAEPGAPRHEQVAAATRKVARSGRSGHPPPQRGTAPDEPYTIARRAAPGARAPRIRACSTRGTAAAARRMLLGRGL